MNPIIAVYILEHESVRLGELKYYVGMTANLSRRLRNHARALQPSIPTRDRGVRRLVLVRKCYDIAEAKRVEQVFWKLVRTRRFVEPQINCSYMEVTRPSLRDMLERYSEEFE